jgi:N-acetylmuramic acid 6-phosphate (MurNAc-6-P) etherase
MSCPRVTELSNSLTVGLDASSPVEVVRLLSCADAQLFTGSHGLPGVHEFSSELARAAEQFARVLQHPRGRVIFGGCGTSGRLAHLLAAMYNAVHPGGRFHYLLAGGDAALLVPAEAVEDSVEAGAGDLAEWEALCGASPEDPTVLVGISCGLSATYVASLLASGLQRPNCFVVAMGFNALPAVAAVAVPGAAVTFHAVLQAMLVQRARAMVLNPVVGPEAVAGSSRMKGGSATWILCTAICEEALALTAAAPGAPGAPVASTEASMRQRLLQAERVVRTLYSTSLPALAALVQAGAQALSSPAAPQAPSGSGSGGNGGGSEYAPSPPATGRIFLLGAGLAGLWGCLDASEATDTYGSAFGDLRGFVAGGWGSMAVKVDAVDPEVPLELRGRGPRGEPPPSGAARASPCLSSFLRHIAPTLTPSDLVIALGTFGRDAAAGDAAMLCEAVRKAYGQGAAVRYLLVEEAVAAPDPDPALSSPSFAQIVSLCSASASAGSGGSSAGVHVRLWEPLPGLPPAAASIPWAASLALKLALNALSTGAHVVGRGVVLGNRMGNMMLTNHKLYLRAVGIVGEVAGVARRVAAGCVLRAVYGWDAREAVEGALVEEEEGQGASALRHVAAAALVERVIPTALLLAVGEREGSALTVAAARAALAMEPRVRLAAVALGLRV